MSAMFRVDVLPHDQIVRALPLLQVTWPKADLPSWQSYIAFYGEENCGQGGVLALRDPADCLCGILVYRLERDLERGLIFGVQLFTAVDLGNSLRAVRALLDAAEMRASQLGCGRLEIRLHPEQMELSARLRKLGLSSEMGFWSMRVDPQHGRN